MNPSENIGAACPSENQCRPEVCHRRQREQIGCGKPSLGIGRDPACDARLCSYIEKEEELAKRISQLEELNIPDTFDYSRITALSTEAMQKFRKIRPRTLGQASRISGVNPSDIQMLMVYIGR